MNIKSVTLNHSSLVLGGPRLHSYCLLWFIRRCMWLFDVLSREVSHLLEKWGGGETLWNKTWICQNGSDRWICGFLVYVCLSSCASSLQRVLPRCVDSLSCVHNKMTLCQKTPLVFLKSVLAISSDAGKWRILHFIYLTYALKIWLEKKGFPWRIWGLITYQRN